VQRFIVGAMTAITATSVGLTALRAEAQMPVTVLAGMPVSCGTAQTLIQPHLGDIARAVPGYILLDPYLLQMPAPIQLFVYAHECAHQLFGSDEATADCWAARTGREQGWLRPDDLPLIARTFAASPGDWTHAPGPIRAAHLARCYYGDAGRS
jgi:hypothetical protein